MSKTNQEHYKKYDFERTVELPNVPHRIRYTYSGDYFAAYCGPWRPCKTGRGMYKPTIVLGKVVFSSAYMHRRMMPNENYLEFMEKYCE